MKNTDHLPLQVLEGFNEFLALQIGYYVPQKNYREFERKLLDIGAAFGFKDLSVCLQWLKRAPLQQEQIDVLARYLSVGETYFFRDAHLFHLLRQKILPELIQKHIHDRRIRIWSAACCTGEEAYSIAILFRELLFDIGSWDIVIYATDLNLAFLRKAQTGCYNAWSFRGMPKDMKAKYFHKQPNGSFMLNPGVMKLVDFSYFNLVDDSPTIKIGARKSMDMIICNNVLIYFSHGQIQRTIDKLQAILVNDGWLIVTPIEAPSIKQNDLTLCTIEGYPFFRKSSQPPVDNDAELKFTQMDYAISSRSLEPPLKLNEHKINNQAPKVSLNESNTSQAFATKSIATPKTAPEEPKDLSQTMAHIRKLADSGKLDDADAQCIRALESNKLEPSLHFLHGSILQALNNEAAAIDAFKRVVYLDSAYTMAYFMLGMLLHKKGDLKEAKRNFRNACSLLEKSTPDETVKGSDDMRASRLLEMISNINVGA
jgi:chemotaxis protein methyltransferase CheR